MGKEELELGNTLLHQLAKRMELDLIGKLLQVTKDAAVQNSLLSKRNHAGETPLEEAQSYKVKRLLEWSDLQNGFYYLPTPPVVLLMAITTEREGAEEEIQRLDNAFPEFNVSLRKVLNPNKDEMLNSIRDVCQRNGDVSALIVIIMAHGIQGRVWSGDGQDLQIQDILRELNGYVPDGRPKVRSPIRFL